MASNGIGQSGGVVVSEGPMMTGTVSAETVGQGVNVVGLGSDPGLGEATREAITKLTDGEVSHLTTYAVQHLGPALLVAATGLLVLFLGYLGAKYLSRVISAPICGRVDETLGKFVGRVIFYCTLLGVGGGVLSTIGVPLGGVAALLAAAGFAIGLAFQGTLSNFAAGVLMLVFRPFKVGDLINVAGVLGRVNEIDFFTTTMDTPDNRRLVIPNSSISGGTIENLSFHPHRRIEIVVGVAYAADVDQTREALTAAVNRFHADTILGADRGSSVVLSNLGDSAVAWKVRLWVAADQFWPLHESLTVEIKRQLDAANISIPFPQLDVHFDRASQSSEQPQRRIDTEDGIPLRSTPRPRVRPTRRDQANVDQEISPRAAG